MKTYFEKFKKYAFRLELLQKYDIDLEKESFLKFKKTAKIAKTNNMEWLKTLDHIKKRKVKIQRIRVIIEPVSSYIKYEIKSYQNNIKHGEEIFFIKESDFKKTNTKINHDYWLFDDKRVLKLKYNKKGKYLGFQEIRKNIQKYIDLKNELIIEK
jgi:hypothetical protein